jgi:hypothetical protein
MTKKILLGVVAALLVIGAYVGSLYWRIYAADAGPRAEYEQIEKNGQAYMAELQAENDAWDKLEAADTYGGATPQETWKMFVAALEAGDTDLASKYFVVTKQEKSKSDFALAKKNGHMDKLIGITKLKKEGSFSGDDKYYTYTTEPVLQGVGMSFSLQINPQTKVWKIESL